MAGDTEMLVAVKCRSFATLSKKI